MTVLAIAFLVGVVIHLSLAGRHERTGRGAGSVAGSNLFTLCIGVALAIWVLV